MRSGQILGLLRWFPFCILLADYGIVFVGHPLNYYVLEDMIDFDGRSCQ